ncbi:Glyoxalase/bleomycin resistance protein/dioxygenase [Rhizobium sp. PDO1-076]|uniref:VOC family protein n=1 Tax=Rhizobium sp. PDO1-076 TaxID=1125979 RepID=UPI00024E2F86|nr:VOC family protein [Rhizobium sp. PDO1-076]EHS49116.1 Glyoxalase/bleomycin resistance protein/dioxygenase [Rhizobium sp. PDO1-076]
MAFAQEHAITDICILVRDTQRSIDFYAGKLGFEINRQAEGFVEFNGAGLTLACWEIDHLSDNTGVSNAKAEGPHKACIAVRVSSPDAVDAAYAELKDKGVPFYREPADYVWNARGAYFIGPDDELWEIYAWKDGGSVGNF